MKNGILSSNESIEKQDFSNLVIFTSTFYKKDDETSLVRSKLALSLFNNAKKCGINVVVIDGGSSQEFLNEAKVFYNLHIINARSGDTMAGERRSALKEALNLYKDIPYFLWTEPEKDDLITPKNLSPMIKKIISSGANILIPKRENKSTMPDFQAREETRANKELSSMIIGERRIAESNTNLYGGEEYDLFFGPKMMTRKGAEYFLSYKGNLDKWDGIITPVLIATTKGEKIASINVDYSYDESQKLDEEGNRNIERKRLAQYVEILNETKKQLLYL